MHILPFYFVWQTCPQSSVHSDFYHLLKCTCCLFFFWSCTVFILIKGGDVMLCFYRLRSTILSEHIQTDTTWKHPTARTSSMVEKRSQFQCYRKRACTKVKTLGHVTYCYLILLTFENQKITIRRKSDKP